MCVVMFSCFFLNCHVVGLFFIGLYLFYYLLFLFHQRSCCKKSSALVLNLSIGRIFFEWWSSINDPYSIFSCQLVGFFILHIVYYFDFLFFCSVIQLNNTFIMKSKAFKNSELNELVIYLGTRITTLKERVASSTNSIEILCINDQIDELKFILHYFL